MKVGDLVAINPWPEDGNLTLRKLTPEVDVGIVFRIEPENVFVYWVHSDNFLKHWKITTRMSDMKIRRLYPGSKAELQVIRK